MPCRYVRTLLVAITLLWSTSPLLHGQVLQNNYYVNGATGVDLPANGGSAATPWKTIRYSLTRITPPVLPQNYHNLNVAGGQVYSTATNGEVFPLTMLYNVALLGSSTSTKPVLSPGGQDGILFANTVSYNRNQVTLRNLEIRGGRWGARMGGSQTIRHRPRFWNCQFIDQSVGGVEILELGNQISDPRFFQCTFSTVFGLYGIDAFASGNNAVVQPDIEECVFEGRGLGVRIQDLSGAGSDVGARVSYCTFRDCTSGVFLLSGINAFLSRLDVLNCHFYSCFDGVLIRVGRPFDPMVTVDSCVFQQCANGYRLDGNFSPGQYSFVLRNNVARFNGRGFYHVTHGFGAVRIISERNLAIDNSSDGFALERWTSDSVNLTCDFISDRALRNGGSGLACSLGNVSASTILIQNGIYCANSGNGLVVSSGSSIAAQFLTLADNGGNGIRRLNAPNTWQADHCIAANNTQGETNAVFPISYSCFQNQVRAGSGNIQTNPQLFRPHYKLLPASPCIDAGDRAARVPPLDFEADTRPLIGRLGSQGGPDMGADEWNPNGNAVRCGVAGYGADAFHPTIGTPSTRFATSSTFNIELRGAIDFWNNLAQIGVLTIGLSEAPQGAPVFDLSLLGAPASCMWIDPLITVGPYPVGAGGVISLPISVPAGGEFVGQVFTAQWWVFKLGTNPASVVTTDALRLTIG